MFKEKLINLHRIILDPAQRLESMRARGFYDRMTDEDFIRKKWKIRMGYNIDLSNPQTFNEKLQWLKLHDHNPIYCTMVDKYEVKEYVGKIIGNDHIIPTLGVWDRFEDIDFNALPGQFVLKCTHDSGGLVIVKDKSKLNIEFARKKINQSLKKNYYYVGREWPYKHLLHRIIAEKYMVDESGEQLRDYKVLCFNGEPKLIEYHQGRFTDHQTQDFYDTEWNLTTISQTGNPHYQINKNPSPSPKRLKQMLELSEILSKGIPHIRVDWYCIEDKLFFGELTFFDGDGFEPFDNPDDDLMLGSWITLPK